MAFHRKVREYVQSQRPGARLGTRLSTQRFPDAHNPSEPIDLVSPDEPADGSIVDAPGVFDSPRSSFSMSIASLRARLPPRHFADPLIDRFFKQVHSIFWVFPPDQFMRRLEKSYAFYDLEMLGHSERPVDEADRSEVDAPSWMCCLFTVLALGCSTHENGHEIHKPGDLFSCAKGLSRCVVEDESIQSIQALLLMVCKHQNNMLMAEFVSCQHRSQESWMDFPGRRNSISPAFGTAQE